MPNSDSFWSIYRQDPVFQPLLPSSRPATSRRCVCPFALDPHSCKLRQREGEGVVCPAFRVLLTGTDNAVGSLTNGSWEHELINDLVNEAHREIP